MNPNIYTFDAPELGKPCEVKIREACLLKTVRFQDAELVGLTINGVAKVVTQGSGLRSPFAPGFNLQAGDVVGLVFSAKARGHLTLMPKAKK